MVALTPKRASFSLISLARAKIGMTAIGGATDSPSAEDGEIPMQADAGKSSIVIKDSIEDQNFAGLADFSMLPSALPVADGPPITGAPTTGEEYLRQVR